MPLTAMERQVLGTVLGNHHRVSFSPRPFCPEKTLTLPTLDELCQTVRGDRGKKRRGGRQGLLLPQHPLLPAGGRRKHWGLVAS